MKTIIAISYFFAVCFSSPAKKSTTTAEPSTTARSLCEGFTCPNNDLDGGLHPFDKDGCSSQFCDCVQGVPYLMECPTASPPLFFDPEAGVCNWCFNMCEKCGSKCPACK